MKIKLPGYHEGDVPLKRQHLHATIVINTTATTVNSTTTASTVTSTTTATTSFINQICLKSRTNWELIFE